MDALQLIEKALSVVNLAALVSSEAAIKSTLEEAAANLRTALRILSEE